jgi:hypothetical protein
MHSSPGNGGNGGYPGGMTKDSTATRIARHFGYFRLKVAVNINKDCIHANRLDHFSVRKLSR